MDARATDFILQPDCTPPFVFLTFSAQERQRYSHRACSGKDEAGWRKPVTAIATTIKDNIEDRTSRQQQQPCSTNPVLLASSILISLLSTTLCMSAPVAVAASARRRLWWVVSSGCWWAAASLNGSPYQRVNIFEIPLTTSIPHLGEVRTRYCKTLYIN